MRGRALTHPDPPGAVRWGFESPAGYVYAGEVNRSVVAMLPALLAIGSCTLLLAPGQQQCDVDGDCAARGFTGATCVANVCIDPVWGCLGDVPVPVPDPTKTVTFSEQLVYTDQSPVTMATVDVCDKLDLDCTSTDPAYPKGLTPDAEGNVTLTVLQGFDGFVRIAGPNIMDSRVFVGRPIITPPTVHSVRLLQPSEYSLIVAYAKQTVDMTRGTAIILAEDCSGNSAAGVSFTCPGADAESQVFYLINQEPTTPPMATATDVDGFGGFLNLPVGATVATSTRASDGTFIGDSSFDVLAYTISYVLISPTPM